MKEHNQVNKFFSCFYLVWQLALTLPLLFDILVRSCQIYFRHLSFFIYLKILWKAKKIFRWRNKLGRNIPLSYTGIRVVSIDLFSVFFMPFSYNGLYYQWSNWLPPQPLQLFFLLSAQTAITDNPSSLTLKFLGSVLLLYLRLKKVVFTPKVVLRKESE